MHKLCSFILENSKIGDFVVPNKSKADRMFYSCLFYIICAEL